MIRQAAQDDQDLLLRLMRAGAGRRPARQQVQAADYDWKTPHRFTGARREHLDQLAKRLTEKASAKLSAMFGAKLALAAEPVTEHYASELSGSEAQGSAYSVELTGEGGAAKGAIRIPAPTAVAWVGRLLGGSGAAGSDRDLSALEMDLLLDIFARLTEAVCTALADSGGKPVSRGARASKDGRLPGQDCDEYCRILLRPAGAQDDSGVSFLLLSDLLEGMSAGGREEAAPPPAELRQRIIGHLGTSPVLVTAHLGQSQVTMRDILALEAGDVLVLPQTFEDPVSVTVAGKAAFTGLLASCEGRYSLHITSCEDYSNSKAPGGQ
jgi:flagellar motor switch protein FliM